MPARSRERRADDVTSRHGRAQAELGGRRSLRPEYVGAGSAMENSANTARQEPAPFGALLLRLRVAAGLTQEQLAARSGLSPNAISALESGKRRTRRLATVELLAAALALDGLQRSDLVAAARAHISAGNHGDGVSESPRQSWRSVAEPAPLVGRVRELDTIVQSLIAGDTRLLTLTGPAGVGKTRLALAAAAQLADGNDRFPDGVTLVDLTPVRDPDLVPGAVARELGFLDIGGRPAMQRL